MKLSRRTLFSLSIIFAIGVGLIAINITGKNKPRDVILVTHDSFVMSKELLSDFEKTTGYNLKLLKAGDTGTLTNRLILTKKSPIGDAVFGIDNSFSGLAISNDVISGSLTPTDFGDVCFNYDKSWFEQHKIPAPTSVADLTLQKYKGLTVIENPNLSSTGLAFLAATVDKFGASGWQQYWKSLKENGLKVVNGWEAAYYTEFSGSSGKGNFPIVLSYASSTASELGDDGQSRTASILDGCFRQTEYIGILKNANNPAGASAVIKYFLAPKFQATFPEAMYMYPIITGTPLPATWSKFAQIAPHPYGDKLDFNANRKSWLTKWSAIFG